MADGWNGFWYGIACGPHLSRRGRRRSHPPDFGTKGYRTGKTSICNESKALERMKSARSSE